MGEPIRFFAPAPRVLYVDIETAPHNYYGWDTWNTNISKDKMIKASHMLSWAAKWKHESSVKFRSTYHDGKQLMLDDLWKLLDSADVLVHYNGMAFDEKRIRKEFLKAGMTAPSGWKSVDLYRIIKARFGFAYNSLAYVTAELGMETKVQHTGFDLWRDCLADDPKAWALMKRYNKQDVRILEPLHDRLRGWSASR